MDLFTNKDSSQNGLRAVKGPKCVVGLSCGIIHAVPDTTGLVMLAFCNG